MRVGICRHGQTPALRPLLRRVQSLSRNRQHRPALSRNRRSRTRSRTTKMTTTTMMMMSATMTGSMTMAIKLNMNDTAVVLWALRKSYGGIKEHASAEEDAQFQRIIKTYERSFRALVRVRQ